MGFVFWHYGKGFQSLLKIWLNFLWFSFEFFSVKELVFTLLSPWHRDSAPKYWRGFNLARSFELFVGNALSRIVGAIVRASVICIGIVFFLFVLCAGLVAVAVWILLPLACVTVGVLMITSGSIILLGFFLFILGLLFISLATYVRGRGREALRKNFRELVRAPWFRRVLARAGLEEKDLQPGSLGSKEEFFRALEVFRVREADFSLAVEWETSLYEEKERRLRFWRMENLRRAVPIARQWRFGYTPILDQFGRDLVHVPGLKDIRVCPHRSELDLLKTTLKRPEQNSVLLVATPGTGRSSLIQYFAKEIRERKLSMFGPGLRLMEVDMDRVVASIEDETNLQASVERLFIEVASAGNIILVAKNIHQYIGRTAQAGGVPDIGPLIAKFLPLPSFRMIATTDTDGFHSSIEREKGILKFFEILELDQMSSEFTMRVLLDAFDTMEKDTVVFTLPALRSIVRYSDRFNGSVPLPERALDLAKEVLVYWRDRSDKPFITPEVVDAFASIKTGVPLGDLQKSERDKLMHLEESISERIVGQKRATTQLARALKKARIGARDSKKPIGTFLFLGPTGVGKTEMAKVLTKAYFGRDAEMIRFDMSEFQSPTSAEQLIGSRELNIFGRLTSKVKESPYGVLLLDELEKADRGVHDLFLQVLDEGFLTDAFGDRVSFTNLIIIATSNAGANLIKNLVQSGNALDDKEREIVDYITDNNTFRVEFLNRFDGVIFFHPLDYEELVRVARILLNEYADELFQNKDIRVTFTDEVAEIIVKQGHDPIYGARSLKRFIANTIESRIVDMIIEFDIKPGNSFDMNAERLKLKK